MKYLSNHQQSATTYFQNLCLRGRIQFPNPTDECFQVRSPLYLASCAQVANRQANQHKFD